MKLLNAKFPIVSVGARVLARDLQFSIEPRKILGLTGPNGCGKSVTLDYICGLITSTGSSIELSDKRIEKLSMYDRWKLGIRRMFQQPSLASDTSIGSAMEHFANKSNGKGLSIGHKLLEEAELQLDQVMGELSYGQRRIVEMAAISQSGKMFLLDEPFAGVANGLISKMAHAVRQLSEVGSVLLVDHSMERLEAISDDIVVWPSQNNCVIVDQDPDPIVIDLADVSFGEPRNVQWTVQNIFAEDRLLVENLSIETRPGEMLYLLGPNGSGKSTLLRTLANLPQPAGIICNGRVSDMHHSEVHFSPQPPKIVPSISVYENLKLMWPQFHGNGIFPMSLIQRLMEICGLERGLLKMRANRLSGGEVAIMSLIGAAASGRPILMLDEPFEGLSASRKKLVASLISSLLSQGVTAIVTAHSVILEDIEARKIELEVTKNIERKSL